MTVKWTLLWLFSVIFSLDNLEKIRANEGITYIPPLNCTDPYGRPQRCIPEFVNAAFNVRMESTNTCGDNGPQEYCIQTGYSNQKTGKSCENICHPGTHSPIYLTDLHEP